MDLTHLYPLTQTHKEDLSSLLKIGKTLSYSQTSINLLVGNSLRHHSSRETIKQYLSIIPTLETLEIKGTPKGSSTQYLISFIENFYQTICELQESSETHRIQNIIKETVSNHITSKFQEYLSIVSSTIKQAEKLKYVTILNSWSYLNIDEATASNIFEYLTQVYLQDPRLNYKYESTHIAIYRLLIKSLKTKPSLFESHAVKISLLFKKSQVVCKKYIGNKNNKEKVFLLACEFIFLCLSDINYHGMKDVSLPSLYGKSFYIESYFTYFFKQTYIILKRPNITVKVLIATKEYLINFTRDHEEVFETSLSAVSALLKLAEEPEVIIILIKTINDLFTHASAKIRGKLLIEFILKSKQDFSNKVSSDLISTLVKQVPEENIKSLEKLFSYIHLDLDEDEIHWLVKVVKGFTYCPKSSEIIKSLLLNYKRSIENLRVSNEIIKALISLSEQFPGLIIEEVILTVNELLLIYEKNKWMRGSKQETQSHLQRYFALLPVLKLASKHLTSALSLPKIHDFWFIITHFIHQYSLTEIISVIELNETLQVIASLTPKLFASSFKDSQGLFAQLSQTEQFIQVFAPCLRTELSIFCSKKSLEQYDYQVLLVVASVKKYLELTDKENLFEELFEYLSQDILNLHSALSELIAGYIHERWREVIRSRQVPARETICILKNCVSQNKSVRNLAMRLLSGTNESVVCLFHSTLYNYECLAVFLDLISGLYIQSHFEYSSSIPSILLPHLNEHLAIPCYKSALTEIKAFLESSFKEMFNKCMWQAYSQILSAFQHYIFVSNKLIKTANELQLSSIINHSQHFFNQCFYSTQYVPSEKFSLVQSYVSPEKFNNWFKQQKPTSQVKYMDQSLVQLQSNFLTVADSLDQTQGQVSVLLARLKNASHASSASPSGGNVEVMTALGTLTAFLILRPEVEVPAELVHLPLANCPAAAVFYWDWLVSRRPQSRFRVLQELMLAWTGFLKSRKFLYSLLNYRQSTDLLNGPGLEFNGNDSEFKQVLDLVLFLQRNLYAVTNDLESQKLIFKIFDLTFESKPQPEVMNFEFGLETCLVFIETFLAIQGFVDENLFNKTFAKLVEFSLYLFRKEHKWVKAQNFNQESRIQGLFEKVIYGLHEVKLDNELVLVNEFFFHDFPSGWTKKIRTEVSVSSSNKKVQVQVNKEKIEILMIFLYKEYQKFVAWNSCLNSKLINCPRHQSSKTLISTAISADAQIGSNFCKLSNSSKSIYKSNLGSSKEEKKFLFNSIQELPPILNKISSQDPTKRSFYLKFLSRSPERNKLYCIPQVLQCGSPQSPYETYSRIQNEEDVWTYLTSSAQHSSVFLNQLIWMLEVSLFDPEEVAQGLSSSIGRHFYVKTLEIIKQDEEEWQVYKTESEFFEKFLLVSAHLVPKDPENFSKINAELKVLSKSIPENIYIPTNPENQVVGLRDDNGRPLQSAKRTPILVTFFTRHKEEEQVQSTQCIFKVNDDVRNDQLCLQIIDLMQDILSKTGLSIYLRPYKVISTITQTNEGPQLSGIIECIPNCKSRDEIGKEGTPSLYTYFIDKFGAENTKTYQTAKNNFIASLAGYAVASYLLQIKDRHNGNILIDEFGHIVHIDFGFILKISPGGNMRFERPGFKMTEEMIDVMGSRNSESFEYFKGLIIKGYLAVREYAESFITMIKLMENSGLTCFRKGAVKDFIKRFYLNMNLNEAIKKMNEKISRANNSFFTLWYDRIQLMQQQIEY